MFKNIIKSHTEMILNPFFEVSDRVDEEDECYDIEESKSFTGNQAFIDTFKSKIDEIALFYDKYF